MATRCRWRSDACRRTSLRCSECSLSWGAAFAEDEGRPEGKPVVVLSDLLWRSRYGSDRNIVGQTITLDGTPHTVVGVLPAGVQFPFVGEADVWTPRYFELTLIPPQRLRQGVGYLGYVGTASTGYDAESS